MHSMFKRWAVVGAAVLLAAAAWAGESWHKVGDFKAGGGDKAMAIKRTVSTCLIRAVDGSVTISEVVVTAGGKDSTVKVGATLNKGDEREVSLGSGGAVDTVRIKDGGSGRYLVFVR